MPFYANRFATHLTLPDYNARIGWRGRACRPDAGLVPSRLTPGTRRRRRISCGTGSCGMDSIGAARAASSEKNSS